MAKLIPHKNFTHLELQTALENLKHQVAQYETLLGVAPFDKEELKGEKGDKGDAGLDGRSIIKIENFYAISSSSTISPTSWSKTVLKTTSIDKYLWNYVRIKYTSGSDIVINPIVIGVYGDKGDPFTYEDFTPEQLEDLQQPITDFVAVAEVAENQREENEGVRNDNENIRISNEDERISNESDRVDAEIIREQQEADRQANTATAISNANTATSQADIATGKANTARDEAVIATSDARDAISETETATSDANVATGKANTATTQANTARDNANASALNADEKATLAETAAQNANNATSDFSDAEVIREQQEQARQTNTATAISNAENAIVDVNAAKDDYYDVVKPDIIAQGEYATAQGDYAKAQGEAIQSDLALKADQADLVQLASQAVKKTDSKIYIGAVQTELDWIYGGTRALTRFGAVLSDGRFICTFGNNLTSFNDVMGISWQRTDITPASIPYERDGYIYVASATELYKLTLEGIDVKTYPIANINSVAVAPNGNIAVGRNGTVGEKTVIYMDNDGLELWSNTELASCAAVDIDGNGNVLAGHYITQVGDGLRIYDSAGVNKKQIYRGTIVDAKFDNDDNVIVLTAVSAKGIYKYDKSLNQLWYRSEVTSSHSGRSKLSIGDDNTIYAPSTISTAGTIDCYRFTAGGDLIYKFASGGPAWASSLVTDNNGYVYLTYSTSTNNTLLRFKEYNKVRIW